MWHRLWGLLAVVALAAILATTALPGSSGIAAQPVATAPPERAGAEMRYSGPSAIQPSSAPSASSDGLNSTLRNVLIAPPCNVLPTRQVAQARDPITGYLYEAFIGCGGIGFSRSVNGGYTFQPAYQIPDSGPHLITNPDGNPNDTCVNGLPRGTIPPPRPISCSQNASAWDPGIAVAPNGTIYVLYMIGFTDGYLPGAQPAVAWSDNDGVSFQGYANVTTWVNATYDDRPSIAVAPNGTVYVAWDYAPFDPVTCPTGVQAPCNNGTAPDWLFCAVSNSCAFMRGQYQIVVAASSNGGRTWSAPWNVTPLQAQTQSVTVELAIAADGTLDALVQQFNSTSAPWWLLGLGVETFTQSVNGGQSWSTPQILSPLNFNNSTWWVDGSLNIDSSGTVWVGFDSLVGNDLGTAWEMASTDGGFSWSSPIALSAGSGEGAAVSVTVAGDGTGSGFAAWMMNNTTGHPWTAWGAELYDNGTVEGPVQLLSDQAGDPVLWIGNTIGVTSLGGPAYAIGFTVAIYQPTLGNTQAEVMLAVAGLATPPGPTQVTLTPGSGEALVNWAEPATNATITGFLVEWYVEGTLIGNATASASATATLAGPLLAFVRYEVTVSAFNGAGPGTPGPSQNITLTAWTVYEGTIVPSTGTLTFDGVSVPVSDGSYSVNATYGGHSLTASATNYSPTTLVLGGGWNRTVWQNFTLALLPSVVRGSIFPATSLVTWDGAVVTLSGGAFDIAAPADTNHTLAASFPGFASVSLAIAVPANATVWENVTLRQLPGTLHLTVVPSSADVSVNGTRANLTSNGSASVVLAPGTYLVKASASGYQTWQASVTLLPGQSTNLSIPLVASSGPPPKNGSGLTAASLFLSPYFLGGLLALVVVLLAVYLLGVRARRREERRPKPIVPADESEIERTRQLNARTPDSTEADPPSEG
jgi:hypothetical protein